MIKTWMIASGKGGVGKSTLAAALAVALVREGKKTVLMDMDIGLRSLDIHLGMENSVVYDVLDYARGDCRLSEAVLTHLSMPQLGLLPAAQLGTAGEIDGEIMDKIFRKLLKHYEYVLADAPAGLTRGIERILGSAENTLLIVTPDDVSVRDAERVIELCREKDKPAPLLIVNRVIPALVQSGDMHSPQTIADMLDVPLLGYVPDDTEVIRALHGHRTVMDTDCPARRAVERIAKRLTGCAVPLMAIAPPQRKRSGWFSRRRGGELPK
ncbi:MAG: septum site-determining protein MinD [Clostridiales bacterium]|nr:septum site-determining protein MinD [Clostridiales bacterium]